jgi:uncharacterized delta-60 repeat protein
MKNHQKFRSAMLLAGVVLFSAGAHAQEGNFDPGWNGSGRRIVDFATDADSVAALQILPDDRVLLSGWCGPLSGGGPGRHCAARLHSDGAIDPTFGPDGNGLLDLGALAAHELVHSRGAARGRDGTLWFAGTTDGDSEVSVIRVDADANEVVGALAFHFNPVPAQRASAAHAIAIGPDQGLIVAGSAVRDASSLRDIAVARLIPDPTAGAIVVDETFGSGGVVMIEHGTEVTDLVVQPDGRILVAGWKRGTVAAGLSSGFVLRLLANGTIDDTFGAAAGVAQMRLCAGSYNRYGSPPRIALDPQGRIAVGYTANFRAADLTELDAKICVNRLNPDGLQDGSFGGVQVPGGTGRPVLVAIGGSAYLHSITVGADSKIIVGGLNVGVGSPCGAFCFVVARLAVFPREASVLDTSFGNAGSGVSRYDDGADSSDNIAIAIGNGGLMIAGDSFDLFEPFLPRRFGVAKVQLGSAAFAALFADGFEAP